MTIKLKEREDSSFALSEKTTIQLKAKLEAEDILNEAYYQTDSIYRQVQEQLIEFKSIIKEYKKIIYQENETRLENLKQQTAILELVYAIKYQLLVKKFEYEKEQMNLILKEKSDETEKKLIIKKEEHQKEIMLNFERLRNENEWITFYHEQVKSSLENKEKKLFLTIQKERDRYKLNEQELKNQLNYYKELKKIKETRIVKIGLVMLIFAALSVIQLTFAQPQHLIETVFPILIACAAVNLLSTNLVEDKKEKNYNKLFSNNQLLTKQNLKFKNEIAYIEEELKEVLDKKAILEKTDRSFSDNFQFLKIIQQDLKESEMKRKILESENAALRKYLILQKKVEE